MPSGHGIARETSLATGTRTPAKSTTQLYARKVQTAVPLCANSCLSSQISKYNCAANDLSCLCTNYSADGFALGELAFICLQEQCSEVSQSEEVAAYNICSGVQNHVTATHTILTISTAPTATTTASSTTSAVTLTSTGLQISSARPSSESTSIVSGPSTTSYAPTVASDPPAASQSSSGGSSLTTAQAIGVSIACFGGAVLVIGLVYLFTFMRRRRLQKLEQVRDSYDFVDDAPRTFTPVRSGRFDGRGPFAEHAGGRSAFPPEKHHTYWPGQYQYSSQPPQDMHYGNEKAQNRDQEHNVFYGSSPDSHISNSSQRTTAQLLPDKPTRMHLRPQATSPYRGAVSTPATVFEEESVPRMTGGLAKGLPGKAIKGRHPRPPPRRPQYAPEYTRSPESIRQPSLSIEIPKKPPRSESIQAMAGPVTTQGAGHTQYEQEPRSARPLTAIRIPPPPPPLRIRTEDGEYPPRTSVHSKMSKSSRPESLLDYYRSSEPGSSSLCSTTPIEDAELPRPPPATITITKPTYPPRGSRISTASDASHRTSFESTDAGETTPPDEVTRQLTPVRQSPIETSPISDIRYPKVPRPSNQAIPRLPGSSNTFASQGLGPYGGSRPITAAVTQRQIDARGWALSGSTLAAKRRGDTAANRLEQGLYINNSSKRRSDSWEASKEAAQAQVQRRQPQSNDSPLKGYDRNVRSEVNWPLPPIPIDISRPAAPSARQSDLWEPKLTPKRAGDDLYLDVSVATPMYSTFSGRR